VRLGGGDSAWGGTSIGVEESEMKISGAILIAGLALGGCGGGPPSRPYNPRPGYLSSKDMRPVQVDLYRYANKGARKGFLNHLFHDNYEVIDEPPLSFRFPDAYYNYSSNHEGGAQSQVGIHFDLDTMKPATLVPTVTPGSVPVDGKSGSKKYRMRTPQEDAELNRRYVNVSIRNNAGGGGAAGSYFLTNELLSLRVKYDLAHGEDGAKYVGVINGMQIVNYTEKYKGYTNLRVDSPIYVGNVDIENNEIAAFPIESDKKIIQMLNCDRMSNRCRAEFLYHNRAVKFWVDNQHFLKIETVAQKIVQLLNKYRLPPAQKGEY
jgi:hypothetical protein